MRRVLKWIDEQSDLVTMVYRFMAEPLPKSTGYPHALGSLAMFLFVVQLLTGGFLLVYYSPAPDHAYTTVQFINDKLPFGKVLRGLHHFAASGMMIAVGLHLLQVFFWGAYKKPRQIIWVFGVLLLLATFGFSFTGYLLPWDQKAYWATVVGTNIAGSVPIIGDWARDVLRGGDTVGALTLTRFFAIHVFFLPPVVTILIVFHVMQVRKKGITPSWVRVGEETPLHEGKPAQLFWPHQAFRDAVLALIALAVLIIIAWRYGAPIEPVANPSDTAYVPKPEWYYLWLFELLKYFPGELEFVGAVLLPSLGVVGLLLLPYLDRNPERRPLRRPFVTTICILSLIGMTYLGINAIVTAQHPEPLSPIAQRGEKLFLDQRCQACHGVNGGGGNAGPDLAQATLKDKERIVALLRDPAQFQNRSIMPPSDLPQEDLQAIAEYLTSLGPLSRLPEQPASGPRKPSSHFEEQWYINHKFEVRKDPGQCADCHKPNFCQSCHRKRRPDSHLDRWMKFHFGTAREKPQYCAVCHQQSFCTNCHSTYYHTPDWLPVRHKQAASKRVELCASCHKTDFCSGCHTGARPASHTAGWVRQHGRMLGTNAAQCAVCHEVKSFCNSCHQGAKPSSHTPAWVKLHGKQAQKSKASCLTCHSENSCLSCHQTKIPHPADWMETHKKEVSLGPGSFCLRCHDRQEFCGQCHAQ